MRKKRSRLRSLLFHPALPAAFFCAACLLPLLLPADWTLTRAWKGYYTLSAEAGPGKRFRSPGPQQAVARSTAEVSFNTFSGWESVRVAELPGRLDPADPRRDPFLDSVGRYFQPPGGPPRELAYLESRSQPLLQLLAAERWPGARVQILEIDPVALLLRLALLAAAALAVLLPLQPAGLPRWLLALGALPWALRVGSGDLRDLLAFLLLFPLWVRGMEAVAERIPEAKSRGRKAGKTGKRPAVKRPSSRKGKTGRGRKRKPWWKRIDWASVGPAAGLGALGLAVLLLAAPGVRHLAGTLCALLADLGLAALIPAARRWERSRRAHPLFRALPIQGRRRRGRQRGRRKGRRLPLPSWVVPATLAALALLAGGALRLEAGRRDLRFPLLVRSDARPVGWQALPGLETAGEGLPNLADYVAHRAYQESLAFGRPYRVPAPEERVYLSEYLRSGDGFLQTRRVVKRFPSAWLGRTLAAAPAGSVGRLLADQGLAGPVRWATEAQWQAGLRPLLRAAAVALFLLACLTAALLSGIRTFAS